MARTYSVKYLSCRSPLPIFSVFFRFFRFLPFSSVAIFSFFCCFSQVPIFSVFFRFFPFSSVSFSEEKETGRHLPKPSFTECLASNCGFSKRPFSDVDA